MKCHYEVLNLERDADENEIKQAYRKLALKWHPDKNLNNTEDAKEQFQLVQQAYEVLSDRQERAWYDKHREQILRGSNTDYKDNNLDVFQYFTTTCFKGYSDDDNGFYCTYANVFEQIGKEDLEYMDDKDSMYEIPKFGNSQSDYEKVVGPFYDHWMSYSTKKSYVWLDPHDIKGAPNRKIFKLIEKENDKIRQKAKKERNEEVRSLVAFVRKRDKRVQIHIKNLEAKKMENREKQKKLSNQKRQERIKQLNESSEQAEWMKFENVKSELEEIEKKLAAQFADDLSDSEDDSDDIDNLYCVACNKIFKTPKAFKNHELSKKHKENIENMRKAMLQDDLLYGTIEDETDSQLENNSLLSSDNENNISSAENEALKESKSKKKKKTPKNVIKVTEDQSENNSLVSSDNENNVSSAENENLKETKSKKKNKKPKNIIKVTEDQSENNSIVSSDNENNINSAENEIIKETKSKKKKKKSKNVIKIIEDASDIENNGQILEPTKESTEDEIKPNIKQKRQKRKEKQLKKENKELGNHKESPSNTKENGHSSEIVEELDKEKCCATCNAQFPSKNKLFEHLKKTGHGTYISANNLEKSRKKGVKLK